MQPFMPLRRSSHRSSVTVHRPQSRVSFFKECNTATGGDAAPHSCRRVDDNTFRWQTLGQTCSRGDPGSAICVQRLDDSLNSAIHTRYRSLLRSSSMHEPRDPPSEVVKFFQPTHHTKITQSTKKVTRKTKDERCAFEARRAVHRADSHRFECSIQSNAGGTPLRCAPVFGCRCTVFHRCATPGRQRLGFVNDPSAGSPTETLLRLLLPLNDQV